MHKRYWIILMVLYKEKNWLSLNKKKKYYSFKLPGNLYYSTSTLPKYFRTTIRDIIIGDIIQSINNFNDVETSYRKHI